ncbi:MAG TPA: CHAT domain-containing protein [Vicinamibacteria bacterium]|nr:CHAT domain-containing protein [Vicinamibacteria bacterium]
MKLRSPKRPEGRAWLDRFNERYRDWTLGRFEDAAALEDAIAALRSLLEREPEMAETVMRLATTIAWQHGDVLVSEQASSVAEIGLLADTAATQDVAERGVLRGLLLTARGGAHLRLGEPLDASRDAADAEAALAAVPAEVLASGVALLRCGALALHGLALDALHDHSRARAAYADAASGAGAIAEAREALSRSLRDVVVLLFGEAPLPDAAVRAQRQLLWRHLAGIWVGSAVGAARCAAMLKGEIDLDANGAARAIERCGLGTVGPIDVAPVVREASPKAADRLLAAAVEQARQLDLDAAGMESLLCAFAARGSKEGSPRRRRLLERALAAGREVVDPTLDAALWGARLACADDDGRPDDDLVSGFLDRLHGLETRGDGRLDLPRVRAVFDEPMAVALRTLARASDAVSTPDRRVRLAMLVDGGVGRRTPVDRWLSVPAVSAEDAPELAAAQRLAADRFGRLAFALGRWSDTCAVVARAAEERTIFLAQEPGKPLQLVEDDGRFSEAAAELTRVAREATESLDLVPPPSTATFEEVGKRAFAALPGHIREAIGRARVLLWCPDHRTGGDAIPLELFHDGAGWLGTTRQVARLPSLEALVRCVEGTARRIPHPRLLAVSVPEAPSHPYADRLRHADDEVRAVRSRLRDRGWDAPDIATERVSAAFLLERLPWVAHLHVAAHGIVTEEGESLLPWKGPPLRAAELAATFLPLAPTAYVNACQLAATRWVGGGASRGFAPALLAAGSAAVVANLLPVEDAGASELARRFVDHAAAQGFGEALRRARAELALELSPIIWGTTVLFGDPRTLLSPGPRARLLSEELLEVMISGRGGAEQDAVRLKARLQLARGDEDPRLAAAAALLREIAAWGVSPDASMRGRVAAACRVAFELDHLPSAALLAFTLAETTPDEDAEAANVLAGALRLLESLEHEGAPWDRLLDATRARWMRQQRRGRVPEFTVSGATSAAERDELAELGTTLANINLALEARSVRSGYGLSSKAGEGGLEELLRNAVLARRDLAMESMPECFAYARQLAVKLEQVGELPSGKVEQASTALAGLLRWLWRSQNVASIGPDFVAGQVGVLSELLSSLRTSWLPAEATWFEEVWPYRDEIPKWLAELDPLPYDEKLYQAMDQVIARIERRGKDLLGSIKKRDPSHIPDAAAWIFGCLIERNTYSPLEGSVPEDIGERLGAVADRLGADGESCFWPWLVRGFEAMREHVPDELERWRYGLGKNLAARAEKPAARPRSKAPPARRRRSAETGKKKRK